jgi:phosphoserine phosphatase
VSAAIETDPDVLAMPRFRSVVLDVDSTLCAIEGIDWLAARREASVRTRVAEVTARAMAGLVPLAEVYGERLALVQPTRAEVSELGCAYVERLEPGAARSLAKLTKSGVHIVLVSAGIFDAILPVAKAVGLAEDAVNAVRVYFTAAGAYAGFDTASPLSKNGGKSVLVGRLRLEPPVAGVGDGVTDLELRTVEPRAVDAFIAYTGIVEREAVVKGADYVIQSFEQLPAIILG